ncbi:NUDIX domain-containing protein [Chryseobacterium wanjuense]|uniref:NUDIX domain-containing protein n=1 Tax=Chryseobacterium wanjuense TaxID=356305 RepID=A0A1I0NVT5_9FLAO|nr:CoA pyrophosphatase [Chryseobacterium wanjuense]SEW05739.1 NUDIX domain-containing protein [Chryseobacterium wanjuense]
MKKQSFSSSIKKLQENLQKALPGKKAHRIMEAVSAKYLGLNPTEETRKSAVLMLLYPIDNEIHFPLILRNSYEGFHSDEVGFPGGRFEISDENLIQTALRETQEEIGINPGEIQVLGTLTDIFIGPSDFNVLPVVGYLPYRPDFVPDSREVQQIFDLKLDYFSDPNIVGCSEISIPGDLVITPYYEVNGHKVWGATAKIILELLYVLNNSLSTKKD